MGEYIGAHLLVAETSGVLCGLPEGDLGPLVPRAEEDEEEGDGCVAEEGNDDGDSGDDRNRKRKKKKKKKTNVGATLDAKSISKLLEMMRNKKVWESLFA